MGALAQGLRARARGNFEEKQRNREKHEHWPQENKIRENSKRKDERSSSNTLATSTSRGNIDGKKMRSSRRDTAAGKREMEGGFSEAGARNDSLTKLSDWRTERVLPTVSKMPLTGVRRAI